MFVPEKMTVSPENKVFLGLTSGNPNSQVCGMRTFAWVCASSSSFQKKKNPSLLKGTKMHAVMRLRIRAYLVAGLHLARGLLWSEWVPQCYLGLAYCSLWSVCGTTEGGTNIPQLKYLTSCLVPSVGVVPQYGNFLTVSPSFLPRNKYHFYSVNSSTEFPRQTHHGYCGAGRRKDLMEIKSLDQ